MPIQDIPGFASFDFSHADINHTVYVGGQGPGVLLIHELPGMVPQCVDFATRIIEHGFTVFMPLLFGAPNSPPTAARNFLHVCISREFKCFATNQSSPITAWLRALCVERIRASCPGRGIGAIG